MLLMPWFYLKVKFYSPKFYSSDDMVNRNTNRGGDQPEAGTETVASDSTVDLDNSGESETKFISVKWVI